MAYTVHQAKTQFSKLMREAEEGKEVIVMRGKRPAVKIVAIDAARDENKLPFRLIGAFPNVSWTEDAFNPLSDSELAEMGLGYTLDAPLVAPVNGSTDQK